MAACVEISPTLSSSPEARPILAGMLDARMILRCHAFVPVWYWPVLWLHLARLEATAALCRDEGRKGFAWHLERNGVIWISHMDASAAERASRGELPRNFDREPWTRALPLGESTAWASLRGLVLSPFLTRFCGMALTIPELYCDHTGFRLCLGQPP